MHRFSATRLHAIIDRPELQVTAAETYILTSYNATAMAEVYPEISLKNLRPTN